MIQREDLEHLIRRHVVLGKRSAKGYESVKCASCNDYKYRGGFKFEGGSVIYKCFNCGVKGVYDGGEELSARMRDILLAFGVPRDEFEASVNAKFYQEKLSGLSTPIKKKTGMPIVEVPLPERSFVCTDIKSPWCDVGREYLHLRGLSYIADHMFVSEDPKYLGRIIIPCFFRDRIIYWQARAMDDSVGERYKNPLVSTDNVFFNMDELYRYTDEPLFVTEGFFDAASIGRLAVALAGSNLTEFKLDELKKAASRRKVIFVIDKDLNGFNLGMRVLAAGVSNFYVACFPDNIDDANTALQRLGKLWMLNHLGSTAVKGFEAELLLRFKYQREPSSKQRS